MVALFASLKWRLVTSRLRATKGAVRAWIIVGLIVFLLVLLAIAVSFGAMRTVEDLAPVVFGVVFTAQLIAWTLTPLIAFGVDETVDPQRFALLPLQPPVLQRGLLAASLVGYLPFANMIILTGASFGLAAQWWMLPVALVCSAVQLIICVVFARAASTSLSSLMTSRRGRDLGMVVGFGIFVLYMALSLGLNGSESGGDVEVGKAGTNAARALAWTPPGALANLPGYLQRGDLTRAAIAAAVAAATLAIGWVWWSAALRRSLTTVPSSTEGSAPAGRVGNGRAIADSLLGTAKLVVARDAVLTWRDPMRRMPWLMVLVLVAVWPFLVIRGHGAAFGVLLGAVLIGAQAANQYGVEGSGLWLHLVSYGDQMKARGEVLGHALMALIPGVPIVVVAVLVHAGLKGDLWMAPAALGVSLAGLLGSVGLAGYLSAAVPYAMPQSRTSLFASSVPGQKGRTAGATLGLIAGGMVAALPAGAAAWLSFTSSPAWGWLALGVGIATGVAAILVSVRLTARRYLESAPEIFAIVSMGDRV